MAAEAAGGVGWTQMTIGEGRALREAEKASKDVYFLYGSLMDPSRLRSVLGLSERPQLRPASVVGYAVKMWGPYPALVDGPTGNVVPGMAFDVEGAGKKERLAAYETDRYTAVPVIIRFEAGTSCDGKAFVWNRGRDKNELIEGTFGLKDWQQEQLLRG